MNRFELATQVETKMKKGDHPNQDKARINKFLAASSMKSGFQFSFESLFLDMFTPLQGNSVSVKEVKAETNLRRETGRDDKEVAVETPQLVVREEKHECEEVPAVDLSEQTETVEETSTDAPMVATGQEVSSEETGSMSEAGGGKVEDTKVSKAEVRIVHLELEAKFQKALSTDELKSFIRKIESILENEELSLEDLTAATMELIEDLVGKIQPVLVESRHVEISAEAMNVGEMVDEILSAGDDAEAAKRRDFLKRFLARLRDLLESASEKQSAVNESTSKGEGVTDGGSTERKVDQAIMKLMKKLDRPETLEIDPKKLERPQVEVKGETRDFESAAREIEERRAQRGSRDVQESRTKDTGRSVKQDTDLGAQMERSSKVAAQEASATAQVRSRVNVNDARIQGPSVRPVTEAAPVSKGESGQQMSWQNSYNNSASQKGVEMNRANQARQGAQSQQAQQPRVFDQIVQNAKMTLEAGKGEATIQLKPEFLGKVEMKVTVEDKQATVKFTVENAAVRGVIAENIAELRRSLAELGLEVADIEVVLSGGTGDKQGDDADGEERGRGDYGSDDPFAVDADDVEDGMNRITVDEVDGSTVRYVA